MHLLNATLLKLSFGPNLVQKTNASIIYEISRMLFSSKDFSDCNWTRTQNHLFLKRTLNHLAKLTYYDTDKSELENKMPDTSGLVKKTNYDAKIADIEGKIPDVSNLATKTALTTVENKIPSVSSLVKKNRL